MFLIVAGGLENADGRDKHLRVPDALQRSSRRCADPGSRSLRHRGTIQSRLLDFVFL
jgi:hypothetical protein